MKIVIIYSPLCHSKTIRLNCCCFFCTRTHKIDFIYCFVYSTEVRNSYMLERAGQNNERIVVFLVNYSFKYFVFDATIVFPVF